MLPKLRETYLETNGVRLHAMEAGPTDGPLVILLHGFPEFWYGWKKQIGPLADAGYRVLVPDQRGYNLSDKPAGIANYAIDVLADDVIGLLKAVGHEQCDLIGHDWGAAVAWWAAMRYPEHCRRLGILNVPHPVVMRRQLRKNFSQLRKSWYMFFFQLPWLPEALISRSAFKPGLESLRNTSRPGTFGDEDLAQYRQAWSQPGSMTAMINWYRAMLRVPPRPVDSYQIRVPTMMIWGARDRFLGRELAEPSLHLCENGRVNFIEDATHWVQHEEPDRVNELLLSFLRQQFDAPASHCATAESH